MPAHSTELQCEHRHGIMLPAASLENNQHYAQTNFKLISYACASDPCLPRPLRLAARDQRESFRDLYVDQWFIPRCGLYVR